ncbi:hypothetical protein ACFFMM_04905 [Micromonospora chaiyaphumensis]|uniref:Uncharacterized protein n=1 Tax=Micromonospora chaiyaphumensis TaxID=307119 RepID=A0A1C4V959_9ACTN|nr:hypothetical protein [Micromonospora chaiyaphumensis]SCE80331.1 hypothetical protein GA0070214_102134 [Micromonospora chaiyaphumensis]
MTPTGALPSRLLGVADRIPASLGLLAGPDRGRVSLPVRPGADIRRRLANGETGPTGIPDDGWDTYLDQP